MEKSTDENVGYSITPAEVQEAIILAEHQHDFPKPHLEWKKWPGVEGINKDEFVHGHYLLYLREDNYDNGETWSYHYDFAESHGVYLDNFWDTTIDWDEGQIVEVLMYAELW